MNTRELLRRRPNISKEDEQKFRAPMQSGDLPKHTAIVGECRSHEEYEALMMVHKARLK